MRSSAVLVLLLGLAAAGGALARNTPAISDAAAEVKACEKATESAACLATADAKCAWCSSELIGDKCIPAAVGKLVPEVLASCALPADEPDAPDAPTTNANKPGGASCGDAATEDECLASEAEGTAADGGGCAWCTGGTFSSMPASCVGRKAAQWIPSTVAKCKLPTPPAPAPEGGDDDDTALLGRKRGCGKGHKKHDDDDDDDKPDKPEPAPEPELPATCADVKDRKACVKHGAQEGPCTYCEGGFMPAGCATEAATKFVPEMVKGKCEPPRAPKKKHHGGHKDVAVTDDDEAEVEEEQTTTLSLVEALFDTLTKKHHSHKKHDAGDDDDDKPAAPGGFDPSAWIPGAGGKDGKKGGGAGGFDPSAWIPGAGGKDGKKGGGAGGFDPSAWIPGAGGKDSKKGGAGGAGGFDPSAWIPGAGGKGDGKKGGGAGATCMSNKSKHDCLRASEMGGGACAWCETAGFGMTNCVAESQAQFLPSFASTCKFAKKAVASS